jgi:hypothetical protein
MKVYAWVGEDEFGSGEVGLKQGRDRRGQITALAAVDAEKLARFAEPLQLQATLYGKTIRLIECEEVRTLVTLTPGGQ